MSEVTTLMAMLADSLRETVGVLLQLRDDQLDQPSDHPCAGGGTIRDLLTHNIDHERMHVGQIYSARYNLLAMQKSEVHRLVAETIRARADLIAALAGLGDGLLEAEIPDEDWSIREMIDHAIFWERHSVDDLARRVAGEPNETAFAAVVDPLYGALPPVDPNDRGPTPVPEPVVLSRADRDARRAIAEGG